jgi:hypothetical protein
MKAVIKRFLFQIKFRIGYILWKLQLNAKKEFREHHFHQKLMRKSVDYITKTDIKELRNYDGSWYVGNINMNTWQDKIDAKIRGKENEQKHLGDL